MLVYPAHSSVITDLIFRHRAQGLLVYPARDVKYVYLTTHPYPALQQRKVIGLRSSSSSNLLLRPEAIPVCIHRCYYIHVCITRPLSHCRKLIFGQFAIFLSLGPAVETIDIIILAYYKLCLYNKYRRKRRRRKRRE